MAIAIAKNPGAYRAQALQKMETVNITQTGSVLFNGATLFNLSATHGLPLSFAIDTIINQEEKAVNWPEFIDEARKNGRWDFQTIEAVGHALIDADVPVEFRNGITDGMKRYVLFVPHPMLAH